MARVRDKFLVAFIKFSEMWANNNIGNNIETDIDKLIEYVDSNQFQFLHSWEVISLDECYKLIEDLILGGFPIWDYFIIPEWTRNMLELSLKEELDQQEKELQLKYICLRGCKYFKARETSMGILYKCSKRVGEVIHERYIFELQEECNVYKKD